MSTPKLHALLVGISYYQPDPVPNVLPAPASLEGPVRDIALVEAFLKARLGLPAERIRKLTSSIPPERKGPPPEAPADRPSYANLVAAFKALTTTAAPGDLVYVHVCSHGIRALTKWPAYRAPDRWDEAIVPYDIADPAAQYLRDLEIAYLVRGLVDFGLVVTLVFDLCHSAGATRGDLATDVAVRQAEPDPEPRGGAGLVAADDDLTRSAKAALASAQALTASGGWAMSGTDYVLLAGCRANESAYEAAFADDGKNGAVTYWMLDALRGPLQGLSYTAVYNRVLAKVHSMFDRQTPVLLGPGDRAFLGTDRIPPLPPAILVLEVKAAAKRVRLQTGAAVGVRKGARFALYPQGVVPTGAAPTATVEVDVVGSADCEAKLADGTLDNLANGDQAVLVGAPALKRKVKFAADPALAEARAALPLAGAGWLEEAAAGFDFTVSVVEGVYVVGNKSDLPLPLLPRLPATAANARELVAVLVHLARYRVVQEIENHNADSALANKLKVDVLGYQDDYDFADKPDPQPFPPDGAPELRPGQWLVIRVRNASPQALNVCALALQADWSIVPVLPARGDLSYVTLDPNGERVLALESSFPDNAPADKNGRRRVSDVIKVFASVGPADYRSLALPPLQTGGERGATRSGDAKAKGRGGKPPSALDQLFDAMTADAPATRNVVVRSSPVDEWTVAGITFRTADPPP